LNSGDHSENEKENETPSQHGVLLFPLTLNRTRLSKTKETSGNGQWRPKPLPRRAHMIVSVHLEDLGYIQKLLNLRLVILKTSRTYDSML